MGCRSGLIIPSSGMLRRVGLFGTDVSELRFGLVFKGQAF
jgi:hypothetical protein